MSTVFWSNSLIDGVVASDQNDLYAFYKHAKKLDAICKQLNLPELSGFVDDTDLLVNMDQLELPEGMQSTDELMATQGNWVDAQVAAETLGKLLAHVQANDIKFGVLRNSRQDIIEELELCSAFAADVAEKGGKFNLAVVM
jgi:hypothetical protein